MMVEKILRFTLILLLLQGLSLNRASAAMDEQAGAVVKEKRTTADHTRFTELDKPFASGPEVTRACLQCHNLAASQVQRSLHWTWEFDDGPGEKLGKAHVVNNF
ncbi:MAG: hypothetical protein JXR80_08155 [Deltaproteobacteria bacterium]|nr:hypothetical protein [Deltaproteobacteria bacterium]